MITRAGPDDYVQVKASIGASRPDIDPAIWLADPRNIILIEDDNCAAFLWRWIGIYEVHVFFSKRGKLAVDIGALWLDAMFKCGAGMILCVIPTHNLKAKWFARRLGFSHRGEAETIEGPADLFQLEASQWV
jgi:hypothetical protein